MTSHDQHIIDKVKNAIIAVDKDCKIVLFGSRARGDAKKDSDWDFLVLTNKPIGYELRHSFFGKAYRVGLEENTMIQFIIRKKEEWDKKHITTPLYKSIQQDGIVLYGNQ